MPTLRQGSSSPDVTALQQQLKDFCCDPNSVDGNFGPGTSGYQNAGLRKNN
jgi:peptidoglycan hydrolase-like protein with peptidoglycan-binding domain